jgi:hypothetical protein
MRRRRGTRAGQCRLGWRPATREPSGLRVAPRRARNASLAAGVFADVVDVEDMVNISADQDVEWPRSLTS